MIIPDSLKKGDHIGLIATARKVDKAELVSAKNILTQWGLHVVDSPFLFAQSHQFAGNDDTRRQSLQWALEHPHLKAIFIVRGGYGTARILDHINFNHFSPKWFIGFSDVTALHHHLNNQNIASIHGPIPLLFDQSGGETSLTRLKQLLFGNQDTLKWDTHPFNCTGEVAGQLTGGNLSVIHCGIGTKSDFDPAGKILFIEDLDEYLYHIDRMMNHMHRAGKFEGLKGIIIGHFSAMNDNSIPFGETAYEIIKRNLDDFQGPIAFGAPIGHEAENQPVICGATIHLKVTQTEATLSYSTKS